jgi:uncharacterized membrane protein YeaQ/YmgE (transglycosylase-associated protein family)
MSEPANARHPGVIVFMVVGIAASIVAKRMFFDFDGMAGFIAAVVAGGIGGAAGAALGGLVFRKKDSNG